MDIYRRSIAIPWPAAAVKEKYRTKTKEQLNVDTTRSLRFATLNKLMLHCFGDCGTSLPVF